MKLVCPSENYRLLLPGKEIKLATFFPKDIQSRNFCVDSKFCPDLSYMTQKCLIKVGKNFFQQSVISVDTNLLHKTTQGAFMWWQLIDVSNISHIRLKYTNIRPFLKN
jgi:hypothetical protein